MDGDATRTVAPTQIKAARPCATRSLDRAGLSDCDTPLAGARIRVKCSTWHPSAALFPIEHFLPLHASPAWNSRKSPLSRPIPRIAEPRRLIRRRLFPTQECELCHVLTAIQLQGPAKAGAKPPFAANPQDLEQGACHDRPRVQSGGSIPGRSGPNHRPETGLVFLRAIFPLDSARDRQGEQGFGTHA